MKNFHLTLLMLYFVALFSSPTSQAHQTPKENKKSAASDQKLHALETFTPGLSQAHVLRGNGSSIGGDTIDARKLTAWFYGQTPIISCFTVSPSFGVSRGQVELALRSSVKIWQEYLAAKKVIGSKPSLSVNSRFQWRSHCQGEEDLRWHFGTGPIFGNLRDIWAVQSLHQPVAFVNKTHLSGDRRWAKGYVRFVSQGYYSSSPPRIYPDWQREGVLKAMILHELGHVLGFVHTPETVMDSRLVSLLFLQQEQPPQSIDWRSELVFCDSCEEMFSPREQSDLAKETLRSLLGTDRSVSLLRNGENYELSDGITKWSLQSQLKPSRTDHLSLLTHFSQEVHRRQSFMDFSGSLKGREGVAYPVFLSYQKGEQGLEIRWRMIHQGAWLDMGRFLRKSN